VRTPASYCGLYGLRPTHGRISLAGCQPLCATMDTCGFFARTPDAFSAAAACLLGQDTAQHSVQLARHDGLFVRLPDHTKALIAPVMAQMAEKWGEIDPLTAPLPEIEPTYTAFRQIQGYEAWQSQGETIEQYGLQLGPDVAERFAYGKAVTPAEFDAACQRREAFSAWWDEQLGNRILILPTVPDIAPLLTARPEEIEVTRRISHDLLLIAVLTRRPQVNIPVATHNGAPLGISLLGPRGSDRLLVDLATNFMKGE
uniref:amidase family protein n=1 Tax=Enterobacter sp. TaxID=42895 RepID=UPI00296E9185